MKKLLLLLFLIPNVIFALPVTIDKYITEHSLWNSSDRKSLSYITLRCGVLSKVIAGQYKNIANAQEIYNTSVMNASIFSRVSSDIYKTSCINFECIKVEEKASQKKAKKWTVIYKEEIVENIKIYNEIVHGDIKSDFSTCNSKVKPILQ